MRVLKSALVAALALSLCVPAAPAVAATNSTQNEVIPGRAELMAKLGRRSETRTVTRGVQESQYMPGAYVVRTWSAAGPSVADAIEDIGGTVERTSLSGDALLVQLPQETLATRAQLLPGVRSVERSVRMRPTGMVAPADPNYADQWNLATVGAEAAWGVTRGAGVTVAVIDTGVDTRHVDLKDASLEGYDVLTEGAGAPRDGVGHGTHVAGIIAASSNDSCTVGIAPEAKILPVRVMESGYGGSDLSVADGIRWAVDNGADIINLSLTSSLPSAVLVEAITYAQSNDVLVVAASGNEGGRVGYPAALPGVVAVGSSSTSDDVSGFSNADHTLSMVAPGELIVSSRRGGGTLAQDGTSMAAPLVAGAAALVKSANPTLTAAEIKDVLEESAVDIAEPGYDLTSGWGRLNVAAALGQPGGTTLAGVKADDEIPGVPVASLVQTGTLTTQLNLRDVYRFHLKPGQRLQASLSVTGLSPVLQEIVGEIFQLQLMTSDSECVTDADVITTRSEYDYYTGEPIGNSLTLDFVAMREGDYFVPVSIEGFAGLLGMFYEDSDAPFNYTLKTSVTTPVISNNYGQGSPIRPSGTFGMLDGFSNPVDIYYVDLKAGQRLDAYCETLDDTEGWASVKVLGPDAWSPWGTQPNSVLGGYFRDYYEFMDCQSMVAETDGRYYVVASSDGGYAPYRLYWSAVTPEVDDEVPGVAMPASLTATGTVGMTADEVDVWRVPAEKGQRLNLKLSTTGGYADFAVLAPRSKSLAKGAFLTGGVSDGSRAAASLTAPETGEYLVAVRAYETMRTSYTLQASTLAVAKPSIASSATATEIGYSAAPRFSVVVTDTADGSPVVDQAVSLQEYDSAWGGWYTLCSAATDATGRVQLNGMSITSTTSYRVVVRDGDEAPVYGPTMSVRPKAYLGKPAPASRVYANKSILWKGSIKPRHSKGARDVALVVTRKVGSVYKPYKTVTAPIIATGSTSTYGVKLTLPRGSFRIYARHAADANNGLTNSSVASITIK